VCNVEVVVPLTAKRTENRTTASFLVGHNSVGKPVFEEVLVDLNYTPDSGVRTSPLRVMTDRHPVLFSSDWCGQQ
jgi:hypothetical protein